MSHQHHLRELLRPLGVYDLDGPFNGGELDVQGRALDELSEALENIHQESSLATAQDWGIERVARLFARRPVAGQPRGMAAALAALLRIGEDSFTLEAINDTIAGCGIPARVEEVGVGAVSVSFPEAAGEPDGFGEMKKIIEDILPAHLDISYQFWFVTWAMVEAMNLSWRTIEEAALSWRELECYLGEMPES